MRSTFTTIQYRTAVFHWGTIMATSHSARAAGLRPAFAAPRERTTLEYIVTAAMVQYLACRATSLQVFGR